MSRSWKIAGVSALAVVLVVGAIAVVSAQGPLAEGQNRLADVSAQADSAQGRWGQGLIRRNQDAGALGQGGGMRGFHFGPGSSVVYVAAEQLDMSVQELVDLLVDGKTIAEVADEKGVALSTIADAWLQDRADVLSAAVEAGHITQDEADEALAHMEEEIFEHLQSTWPWEHDHEDCDGSCAGSLGESLLGGGVGGCNREAGTGRGAGRESGRLGSGSRTGSCDC